jgi:hypothetical protein
MMKKQSDGIGMILGWCEVLVALEKRNDRFAADLHSEKLDSLLEMGLIDSALHITAKGLAFLERLRRILGDQCIIITGDNPLDTLFAIPFDGEGFIDHRR